ncbi:MAG: hypothetical protein MUQ80_05305, partial [Flavobacteriaceae bacterium]|nr:hypothetical protein [Flavobacteriaceae bacterium]
FGLARYCVIRGPLSGLGLFSSCACRFTVAAKATIDNKIVFFMLLNFIVYSMTMDTYNSLKMPVGFGTYLTFYWLVC